MQSLATRLAAMFTLALGGVTVAAVVWLPDSPVLFGLVFVAAVALTWGALFMAISQRIWRLVGQLVEAEQRRFLVRLPEDGQDELAALSGACNRLLERLTDMSVRELDQNRELKWAQERLFLQMELDVVNQRLAGRLRAQELLGELAHTFSSSLDIDKVLGTVCERVSQALDIDEVAVVLYDKASDDLVAAAAHGVPESAAIVGLRFAIGEGVTGDVWHGEPFAYIADTATDERFLHWKGQHEVQTGSMVAIRLEFGGEKLGLLDCTRHEPDAFSEAELEMLRIVADQASLAVRNARMYERTMELASHDELTGLLNRRHFLELMDAEWFRRIRYGDDLGIIVADIDRFKQYNDRYGHLIGDRVLAEVAGVIRRSVRKVDTVARYGGEEFVVLASRANRETIALIGEKVRAAVEGAVLSVSGIVDRTPTISVGVASACPAESTETALDLLDAADQALLVAKESGRNRVVVASEPAFERGTGD